MKRSDLLLRVLQECDNDEEFVSYRTVTKEVGAEFSSLVAQYPDEERELIGEYLSFLQLQTSSLARFAYELGCRDAKSEKKV